MHVQDRLADEIDEGGTAALQDQESRRHAGQERTGSEHQRMKVPPAGPMNPAVDHHDRHSGKAAARHEVGTPTGNAGAAP